MVPRGRAEGFQVDALERATTFASNSAKGCRYACEVSRGAQAASHKPPDASRQVGTGARGVYLDLVLIANGRDALHCTVVAKHRARQFINGMRDGG